jgi:small-conductance mechanosensitive channel
METLKTIWSFPLFVFGDGTSVLVSQLILVGLVLLVGYVASRLIARVIRRRLAQTEMRADAAYILQRIIYFGLLIAVVMTALSLLHVPLAAFAFISGAVAIGVGFGAQNIINNFISGWILLIERPVRVDDFVEVDSHQGVVESIGNRSTRIRRTDGVHLLIPNSQMLERVVINWTLIDHQIRTMVRVGVAYGSPLRRVAELIEQAAREHADIRPDPRPLVVLDDFGDSAVIFDIYFWCDVGGERELRQIRSDIRLRIDELFAGNGIVIAFPQQDVHVSNAAPLEVRLLDTKPDRPGADA